MKRNWRIIKRDTAGRPVPDLSWLVRHYIRNGKIDAHTPVGEAYELALSILNSKSRPSGEPLRHGHFSGGGL